MRIGPLTMRCSALAPSMSWAQTEDIFRYTLFPCNKRITLLKRLDVLRSQSQTDAVLRVVGEGLLVLESDSLKNTFLHPFFFLK